MVRNILAALPVLYDVQRAFNIVKVYVGLSQKHPHAAPETEDLGQLSCLPTNEKADTRYTSKFD